MAPMKASLATVALSLALSTALVGGACRDTGSSRAAAVSGTDAARLLIDRNWIDVWPQTKDERLHVYRFTPGMGGGVYQDRTVFKGTFELFLFALREDELTFVLPETEEHVRTKFKIERVDGPAPFDLRLTLERSPRGPRVYYGMRRETQDLDTLLATHAR